MEQRVSLLTSACPDGHPWEVAHNPHWQLGEDGSVALNPDV